MDMKLKYTGSEAMNLSVAEHRDGNAELKNGDTFEVPQKLGKSLLSSSAHFEEVAEDSGSKGDS